MTIDDENVKGFTVGWSMAAKPCDSCKSAPALLFCRPDSAFLCLSCDSKIHGANKLASRHERVWLCEVCEQAPASVTCKADAAALCVTCDSDIHSANPLARRHDRVPIVPFYESAESLVKSSSSTASAAAAAAVSFLVPPGDDEDDDGNTIGREEVEAASWILPNPNPNSKVSDTKPAADLFFSDFDPFLDLDYGNSINGDFKQEQNHGTDSVVPVQNKPPPAPLINNMNHSTETCFDIDFCKSKLSAHNYATAQSLSHSVSSSSLDVGVVPDGSSMSDISYPFGKQMMEIGGSVANQVNQLSGMDREARVLRYREKRKNRKFEKTIRYASRKAYAETRPRIKGRFAKRTEMDADVDRMLYGTASAAAASFMADAGYGVVPSF